MKWLVTSYTDADKLMNALTERHQVAKFLWNLASKLIVRQ